MALPNKLNLMCASISQSSTSRLAGWSLKCGPNLPQSICSTKSTSRYERKISKSSISSRSTHNSADASSVLNMTVQASRQAIPRTSTSVVCSSQRGVTQISIGRISTVRTYNILSSSNRAWRLRRLLLPQCMSLRVTPSFWKVTWNGRIAMNTSGEF